MLRQMMDLMDFRSYRYVTGWCEFHFNTLREDHVNIVVVISSPYRFCGLLFFSIMRFFNISEVCLQAIYQYIQKPHVYH